MHINLWRSDNVKKTNCLPSQWNLETVFSDIIIIIIIIIINNVEIRVTLSLQGHFTQ